MHLGQLMLISLTFTRFERSFQVNLDLLLVDSSPFISLHDSNGYCDFLATLCAPLSLQGSMNCLKGNR